MHDFACLVEHLHLLLRIAVVGEDVDLRDDVVGQLIGKLVHRDGLSVEHLAVLLLQLGHGGGSSTAGSLIGGHVDAADVAEALQTLEHHHHHDGRAVGVSDDVAGAVQGVLGIALGHHEGYVGVHPESRAIVYHHGAMLRDGLGKVLAGATSGAHEGDVHAAEVVVMLQELDLYFLPTEGILTSGTTLATEEQKLVDGERSLIQYSQEFLSHGAAGAHNCYSHLLLNVLRNNH